MPTNALFPLLAALALAAPALSKDANCLTGDVTFTTGSETQTLNLFIHESKLEVAKGLMGRTELPEFGGVLAVYDAPRNDRRLANAINMTVDMMSFDSDGKAINLMIDETGNDVDYMPSGNGMQFAVQLSGGTIQAKGFTRNTAITDLACTEYE
jgi:uncharacterized membrane protein (UPF0127 family)